jgi:ribonucleoside-diphosphate reductase alpha chain
LKTTYYLRTIGATHAEKSTTNSGELNSVEANEKTTTTFCAIDDPECEACQ